MADQNDPRLELIFKDLKTSVTLQKASSIELQIWKIWMEHDNPKVKSSMFLGIAAMNNQQFGKALEHFRLLTEIEPDFAEGWNKRATVFYLLGRFNESQEDVERTLKLEPRHFGALDGMGLIFIHLNQPEKAIDIYNEMLEIFPNSNSTKMKKDRILSLTTQST